MTRDELRQIVFRAIADQWNRDTRDEVIREPEGHQYALTDAVVDALTSQVRT